MHIDFKHNQSAHCENGVASNLLKHQGIEVSEPMVFGLGSGLFFVYLPFIKVNFSPAFSYRPMPGLIFKRAAKLLGIKIKRQKFSTPEKAQQALDQNIEKNIPTGLQVGVYGLTYFPVEYRFHFNAHNLVVYGKTPDNYLISDPVMESVTTLTHQELEKVRFAKGALAPKGHLYYPLYTPKEINLENAIRKAIKKNCNEMLAPVPIIGVKAIRMVGRNIAKWPKKIGVAKTNHYLGQLIRMQEEIGTGGGGFRFIYAAFLQESAEILKNDELSVLSKEMTEIGDMWRDLAVQIARVYKKRSNQQDIYTTLSKNMLEIAEREEAFFKKLKKAV